MTGKHTSRAAVASYLALVFLSGAGVGAFGHRLYSAKTVDAAKQRPDREAMRKKYLLEMESRLKLDADQMRQLVAILDEFRGRYQAARDRVDPEVKQIQQEQRGRIRSILRDEQRSEYEKLIIERERKRAEEKKSGGF